ncbi:hypothetical protein CB1_001616014 [Camelus ferus]|nr:hypothetical protein CB1_001616014 [Camelus ferus]
MLIAREDTTVTSSAYRVAITAPLRRAGAVRQLSAAPLRPLLGKVRGPYVILLEITLRKQDLAAFFHRSICCTGGPSCTHFVLPKTVMCVRTAASPRADGAAQPRPLELNLRVKRFPWALDVSLLLQHQNGWSRHTSPESPALFRKGADSVGAALGARRGPPTAPLRSAPLTSPRNQAIRWLICLLNKQPPRIPGGASRPGASPDGGCRLPFQLLDLGEGPEPQEPSEQRMPGPVEGSLQTQQMCTLVFSAQSVAKSKQKGPPRAAIKRMTIEAPSPHPPPPSQDPGPRPGAAATKLRM